MAAPTVTNTFTNGTTADAAQVNTNFSDLVTYISNRNDGTATWDRVLVTSASAVPLIVNNSTGTANIANFQDNGSNVFQIVDGGDVIINATKKFYLDGGGNTYIIEGSADDVVFTVGGNDVLELKSSSSLILGTQAALATSATTGFTYIPTCAGAPSGTPTAFTGKVAMVFDTTNNKFMIYDGAWIGATLS